jgi:tRNA (cytidine/uridine-2'-O-)-methyltransferase
MMTEPARSTDLCPHRLSVALVHPQIAPNTGNIGRLCVATGTRLHLVRPMGFVLSDHKLRRSAMDYWPRLQVTVHDDLEAFSAWAAGTRLWLFTSKATRSFWDAGYEDGDCLVFGSETTGLPSSFVERHSGHAVRIPQVPGERCLNLSTAAGIALYEALRRVQDCTAAPKRF